MTDPTEIKSVPCTSCGTMTEQDQLNNVDWDWWGTCNDCTEEPEGLAKDITAEYVFLSGENIADEDNELLIAIKRLKQNLNYEKQ